MRIIFDEKTDKVKFFIGIGDSNFNNYIDIFNRNNCTFEPKFKYWYISSFNLCNSDLLLELGDFGIECPLDILNRVKEFSNKPKETYKKRRKYLPELTKKPPLYDFQKEDIEYMLKYNAFLNANDTGLGKTYETIAVINHLIHYEKANKILIITVKETIYNWKYEILKFSSFFEEDDIKIITSKNKDAFDNIQAKVVIMSYSTFRVVMKFYAKRNKSTSSKGDYRKNHIPLENFLKEDKGILVLDEAHNIKDRTTFTFKYTKLIKSYFSFRYLLSATPYPNSFIEAWSIMYMIEYTLLGKEYKPFLNFIADLGKQVGKRYIKTFINKLYPEKIEYYVNRISPYVIQRKKNIIPGLITQYIKTVVVEPPESFYTLYKNLISNKLRILKKDNNVLKLEKVKNVFSFLLLLCSEPSIALKDGREKKYNNIVNKDILKYCKDWKLKNNPKLEICTELIKKHNKKTIIWTYHPHTNDLLYEYYSKYFNCVQLHGSMPANTKTIEYRQEFKDNLNNNKDIQLAIVGPQVLGVGANLPEVKVTIGWDRIFSLISKEQKLGRNFRLNSTEDVYHYDLVFASTLEEGQIYLMKKKKSLNDLIANKDNMSKEDWKNLFNGDFDELDS